MKKIHINEKGQIVVLLALVLIGLLGFTALAVDGGMIYADRRYSQSAADAASLAGAGAVGEYFNGLTTKNTVNCVQAIYDIANEKAANQAELNDFWDLTSQIETSDHGSYVTCVSGPAGYVDVFVALSKVTSTSFVQVLTREPMRNTVGSTTRIYPAYDWGSGNAIEALRTGPCDSPDIGVTISGTSDLTLLIGGIWSNSCLTFNGGVSVDADSITYNTTDIPFDQNGGSGEIDPEPVNTTEVHVYKDYPGIKEDCAKLPSKGVLKSDKVNSQDQGNYSGLDLHNGGKINLNPGLYCITGTVKMTGGSIWGEGVTIYYEGEDFTINGGVSVHLMAANVEQSINVVPYAIEDLLLYVPAEFEAVIKLNGGANSVFSGTIFAPSSFITVEGNADASNPTGYYGSIIGYDVKIAGTPGLKIEYRSDSVPSVPSSLQVQK